MLRTAASRPAGSQTEQPVLSRLAHVKNKKHRPHTGTVEVTVEGQGDIPLQVKTGFYRIAQEAFNNVIKHANPSRVVVTVQIKPKQVMLYHQGRRSRL